MVPMVNPNTPVDYRLGDVSNVRGENRGTAREEDTGFAFLGVLVLQRPSAEANR